LGWFILSMRGDKMKNVKNTGSVYDSLYVRPGVVREGASAGRIVETRSRGEGVQ